MKTPFYPFKTGHLLICITFWLPGLLVCQIPAGVYMGKQSDITHEIKVEGGYMVHTEYRMDPPEFIQTRGGTYSIKDNQIDWQLEFNSAYQEDGVKHLVIPFVLQGQNLSLEGDLKLQLQALPSKPQPLDGIWYFATRGPDTGQERRGASTPRRTMKFLLDGRFQWIAFNSETFEFSGTGGGTYSASQDKYTEHIQYFSRDNDRVGAVLEFNYELSGDDWHHKGVNSRGEPLYEIWARP